MVNKPKETTMLVEDRIAALEARVLRLEGNSAPAAPKPSFWRRLWLRLTGRRAS